jgi:arginine decarboxylase
MDSLVPRGMFFTKGHGKHKHALQSFEYALRDAQIAHLNLVRVSSIYAPGCKILSLREGLKCLRPGQVVFTVMAEVRTDEPNRLVSAGIGMALPAQKDQYGYISEFHGYGMTEKKTADLVEDMAASMLASTLGIEFDPEEAYDTRRALYRMSGRIVRTRAVVQTVEGDKRGLWTSAVAAAVFIMDPLRPNNNDG